MLLGEDGAVEGARDHTLFIDMSTIAPGTARGSPRRSPSEGHAFVDAPVTGSSPKAKTGTLTIMVGGTEEDVERARPLFEVMGEKIVHGGEAGQGQAVKVISQASPRSTAPRSRRRSPSAGARGWTSTRCSR